MSSAKVTLIGLYNFDNTLFDNLTFPTGVDKQTVIDTILMRGGEYEVTYPNGDLLKQLFGSWSSQWANTISAWIKARDDMNDINPLENYDRYESWSDSASTSEHNSGSMSTSMSDSSQGSESMTATVSGYDTSALVNDNGQSRATNNNNVANTVSGNSNDNNSTSYNVHEGHLHGNIGVTTAGAMYSEFYNVMLKYGNIYDSIATIFLQSFVIPIL